jgi:hypothetical protein
LSVGPRGHIPKLIKLSETTIPGFYNLAFGDKDLETGDIDDKAISNNGDSEKILATIVSAIYTFTDSHPNAWVYATGSTPSRTRLYRIGITKYFDDATADFEIYGLVNGEWYFFDKNVNYSAFVVKRKRANFT